MSITDALEKANILNTDLIEIAPNAQPPVVKLMNLDKFKYQLSQKEKEQKKKLHKTELKELQFKVNIDTHDLETKCRHAREFLNKGHVVKIYMIFSGREITHKEVGEAKLKQILDNLADVSKYDSPPKLEGKQIITILRAL